ncbi:MAG: T9SS type A sorting domain-containing protein [Saprospiraceae bacterium]|nr:T9SS type A sorting domain-containing protein [Saprospiraceae bacterium]
MVQSKSLSKDLNQLGGLEAFCKGNIQILTSSNSYEGQSRYIPLFNCNEEEYGGQQSGLKKFIPAGINPNPSTGIVVIESGINAELIHSVRISDLYGRHKVHITQFSKAGSVIVDFSGFSPEIYIVELIGENGNTLSSQRLIIHK